MSKKFQKENHKHKFDNNLPIEKNVKLDFEIKQKYELTALQKEIIETSLDKSVRLIILDAPTGCAKTYTAVFSLIMLLSEKKIHDITYIRSLIQSKDGETGFLPGSLEDRCLYFNVPLFDQLNEILNKSDLEKLVKEERIKTIPTSMLRGYNCAGGVCLDECQNVTFDSLFTVATRLKPHAKLFMLGDNTGQNDLGAKTGFAKFCKIYGDEESKKFGVRYFKLDSSNIVRSEFVKFLVEKLKSFEDSKKKEINSETMFPTS